MPFLAPLLDTSKRTPHSCDSIPISILNTAPAGIVFFLAVFGTPTRPFVATPSHDSSGGLLTRFTETAIRRPSALPHS
ncbi:hypothetical protein N656DRAFT_447561 [Canariomyces notabilis]|uniref:Uncharacterized protein n=1 Tax=Canariomyces notabilis TaxID=2074819 RepID=A0AAN6T8Y0_9PEZI|nr:hypothetical protein N656DRAFT_447561 [Canariomyces arenarius]